LSFAVINLTGMEYVRKNIFRRITLKKKSSKIKTLIRNREEVIV